MKKLFSAAFMLLISFSSFAQGTVVFNNRTSAGDRPITRMDNGQGFGTVPGATAQLWLVAGALGSEVFTPLTPTTPFLTGNAAPFFMEINPFIVPGVQPGESARFSVRAWAGASSYEEALTTQNSWIGISAHFTVNALGGTPPGGGFPISPPTLDNLQSFQVIPLPEPPTIALCVLGGFAFLVSRKR